MVDNNNNQNPALNNESAQINGGVKEISEIEMGITSKFLSTYVAIKISPDYYSAVGKIRKVDKDAIFGIDHVKEYLKGYSITYGLINANIMELIENIKHGPLGKEILIAKGSKLQEGVDGEATYNFRIKLLAGKVGEDKIDFRERGSVNNVRSGQILARIVAEIPGKPGVRIDNEIIPAKPVKAVSIPTAGCNVSVFNDKNVFTYTAMVSGHARMVFNEMQVNPDYIIPGDLDYTKGNIDFVGNVEVMGTVKSGFKIVAGGDVIVRGDVESDVIIQAKNDITVKKNINCGKNPGKIIAGGNVNAFRVVNSVIKAEGDVFIRDQIMESTIYCDGKFSSTWGKIVGSEIEAVSGIHVNTLGLDNSNAKNIISAGKTYRYSEKLDKINSELEIVKNELALLAKGVSAGAEQSYQGSNFENLSVKEQERIKRLGIARSKHAKSLNERKEKLQKEKDEILPNMRENPNAIIEIKGGIYPTCYIKIGTNDIKILDDKKSACIFTWNSA